jgi:putative flippase GtrA
MKAIKPVAPIHGRMVEQIPAFAAIGVIGYFVDSGITLSAPNMSACRQSSPAPGFIIATIVNFGLNRAITFRHSRAPVLRAFPRYCGVASVGLAINYAVYSTCVISAPRLGIAVTPAILPLFIAAGSGVAMVLTFVGFRFFAFGH